MTEVYEGSALYECVRCPDREPAGLQESIVHVRDAHGGQIRNSLRRHQPADDGRVPAPPQRDPDSGLVTVAVVHRLGEPPTPLSCYPIGAHLAVGPDLHRITQVGDGLIVGWPTPMFTGGWCVYHRPTGLRVPGGVAATTSCLSHALAFAQDLDRAGVDWSGDEAAGYRGLRVRFGVNGVGAAFASCNHPFHCDDVAEEMPDPFADDEDDSEDDDDAPVRWWRRLALRLRGVR